MRTRLLCWFSCFLLISPMALALSPQIQLPQGKVTGNVLGSALTFKGIPYAQAPLGKLRWQPPQPLPDNQLAIIQAASYQPQCPQRSDYPTSEDCLFINVFTDSSLDKSSKRPVLVWIHGGGYVGGSGYMGDDSIQHWVKQGIVLVSFNYRLGALGIFSHPNIQADAGANYSVMDMVAALKWVKNNIAEFGGNPQQVTIAGGSAGGMAIQMLMVTPQSAGLFHGAIAQSGYGSWPFPRANTLNSLPGSASAETISAGIAEKASGIASDEQSLVALNNIPASRLVEAIDGFHLPIIDGVTLPEEPGVMFIQGKQHAVPYISGGNSFDGSVYPWSGVPAARLESLVAQVGGQVKRAYELANPGFESLSYQHLFGDLRYVLAAKVTTEGMSQTGAPGYRYFFDLSDNQQGAPHGSEVNVVFRPAKSPAAQIMQSYWRNFITSGNPNGEALPQWQAVNKQGHNWMVLDNNPHLEATVRPEKLSLLEQAYRLRVQSILP